MGIASESHDRLERQGAGQICFFLLVVLISSTTGRVARRLITPARRGCPCVDDLSADDTSSQFAGSCNRASLIFHFLCSDEFAVALLVQAMMVAGSTSERG